MLFQWLERAVVLMRVLLHFRFHLSNISSIFRKERGVLITSMIHIDLVLVQLVQCSTLGFPCWSGLHLRLAVYCCTTLLLALSGLFVRVASHFSNEGKLPFSYLIFNRRHIKKSSTNYIICYSIFFHLCHCEAKYPTSDPV